MRLLILLTVITTGCTTAKVSDYQQGCQDGVRTWIAETEHAYVEESILEIGCKNIEDHFRPKKQHEPHVRER